MAGTDNQLVKIDQIVVDGTAIAFEDGSGVIEGAAGFEATPVLSASGDDYLSRKRVARMLTANLQFGPGGSPSLVTNKTGIQISMRDSVTKRRILANNASFSSMGSVGAGGAVQVKFALLSELQWL